MPATRAGRPYTKNGTSAPIRPPRVASWARSVRFPEVAVEREQHRGCIATSSTESAADRNPLLNVDADFERLTDFLQKKLCAARIGKVRRTARHSIRVRGYHDGGLVGRVMKPRG